MALFVALGSGEQLAKLDIESAYRLIPQHQDDRPLLGMRWRDRLYVNVATAIRAKISTYHLQRQIHRIVERMEESEILQYLDDFLLLGSLNTGERQQALRTPLVVCEKQGVVPIMAHKMEGPSTAIMFLGIELDTKRWRSDYQKNYYMYVRNARL